MGGGVGIIGGILAVVFGFVGERHPLNNVERRSAAEMYNQKLREERGLGPEADWQDEQPLRGPFGHLEIGGSNLAGFSLRF